MEMKDKSNMQLSKQFMKTEARATVKTYSNSGGKQTQLQHKKAEESSAKTIVLSHLQRGPKHNIWYLEYQNQHIEAQVITILEENGK